MSLSPAQRHLEKQIKQQRPQLLAGLSGERKREFLEFFQAVLATNPQTQLLQTQVTTSSSPVPPAELLAGYNQAIPNGAERLFSLVEKQSDHRQRMEDRAIDWQIEANKRGQIFALLLAVIFGGLGGTLGIMGHDWLAGGIFTTTIGGLAYTFISGQRYQQRNLDKKAPK